MATTRLASATHIPRYGWQDRGACRNLDLELFFGHEGEPRRQRLERELEAVQVCAGCPVRDACLRHAVVVPERYGVWGATTEEQRRDLISAGRRLPATRTPIEAA